MISKIKKWIKPGINMSNSSVEHIPSLSLNYVKVAPSVNAFLKIADEKIECYSGFEIANFSAEIRQNLHFLDIVKMVIFLRCKKGVNQGKLLARLDSALRRKDGWYYKQEFTSSLRKEIEIRSSSEISDSNMFLFYYTQYIAFERELKTSLYPKIYTEIIRDLKSLLVQNSLIIQRDLVLNKHITFQNMLGLFIVENKNKAMNIFKTFIQRTVNHSSDSIKKEILFYINKYETDLGSNHVYFKDSLGSTQRTNFEELTELVESISSISNASPIFNIKKFASLNHAFFQRYADSNLESSGLTKRDMETYGSDLIEFASQGKIEFADGNQDLILTLFKTEKTFDQKLGRKYKAFLKLLYQNGIFTIFGQGRRCIVTFAKYFDGCKGMKSSSFIDVFSRTEGLELEIEHLDPEIKEKVEKMKIR